MRDRFKAAVTEVLDTPVTEMHTTMWKVYKQYIRDINPEDLPVKVRPKYARIREIMEGRINKVVKDSISNAEYMNRMSVKWGWKKPANEETNPVKVREKVEKGYPLTAMNGRHGAEFRCLLFEIYDQLPKRTPKKKAGELPPISDAALMGMLMEME